jgi:beta-ribofuranosylaminobenzene 5'-phosphate synthase
VLILRAYPRIHIGLIDLGSATGRRYGGLGFSLSRPAAVVHASHSQHFSLTGIEKLDSLGRRDVSAALARLKRRVGPLKIHLKLDSLPPQHVGLGTKTTVVLALLTAAVNLLKLPLSSGCLQTLSARGGASGVGINSFFCGGLIADAGHERRELHRFTPSSARTNHTPPPVIARVRVPPFWRVCLVLPDGRRYNGATEVSFFARNTPIPRAEILSTLALVYHGIIPAFLTADLPLLRESLSRLHKVGFKRRELVGQTSIVRTVYTALSDLPNAAVGLSSMGPLLYVIVHERELATASGSLQRLSSQYGASLLGVAKGRNRGFSALAR